MTLYHTQSFTIIRNHLKFHINYATLFKNSIYLCCALGRPYNEKKEKQQIISSSWTPCVGKYWFNQLPAELFSEQCVYL